MAAMSRPFRVERRRWHHDLQPGHVREPRVQRLRVLRRLLAAAVDDRPDDQRHRGATTVHVMPVGSLIDEGIEAVDQEVHARGG